MAPLRGARHCFIHSPAHKTERDVARRLGGKRRRRTKAPHPETGPAKLRDANTIQSLVERAADDVLRLENSVARARTLGYLAGVAIKAYETHNLEERLTTLEDRVLKARGSRHR